MITAESLLRCHDTQSLAELMQAIGYPAIPIPVVADEWRRVGIEMSFSPDARLSHLCRLSTLHLFVLESTSFERDSCAKFIHSYSHINCIVKPVIINISPSRGALAMYAGGSSGRLRAREISLTAPRPRDIDAFNLIELTSEVVAPEKLFDRALDRVMLSREFFRRFREAWYAIRGELRAQFGKERDEDVASQALLVLSRILFLYFIQEKGWLDQNRRFIVDHFHAAAASGEEFFSSRLTPLFFGCLNRPLGQRDEQALALGSIPYLNGGLFDRSPFERRHHLAHLSNALLQRVIEGVFERFSFTTEEGEEEDAHIDPEMLGKVFESLMAGEERLASGSFYTPKEIVDRLAGDSIVRWLLDGRDPELAQSLASTGELGPEVTRPLSAELLERIGSLRLIDPACGSGAFLLSAVKIIESLTRRLASRAGVDPGERLRQRIVERSIHGVDLKPEAVRLCELRLWLAIVSESDTDVESVPPLPNLDRNILQGNTLLGALDFLGDGRGEIYREWSYALRARAGMLEHYRRCTADAKPHLARALREADVSLAEALIRKAIAADQAELRHSNGQSLLPGVPERRESQRMRMRDDEIRKRIEALGKELRKARRGELEFFSFDVHYAQVMCDGGFDIVIGNPPWIRSSRIPSAMRRMLSERYRFFRASSGGFSQPDVSVAFCERAMQITRPGGMVSLLLPAKIATAGYAVRLRTEVVAETDVLAIHDWSDRAKELFDADTFPMSLMLRRGRGGAGRVEVSADGAVFKVSQSKLPVDGFGSPWLLAPEECRSIIERMRLRHPTLAENLGRSPLMGVKTGANQTFLLDDLVIRPGGMMFSPSLGVEIPRSAVCRTVRGRDLRPWRAGGSTWMLWPPANGWSNDCEWADELARALGAERDELRLAWVRAGHLGTKVAWKDVSRGLQAAVLPATTSVEGFEFPLIPNQTLYSIDTASMDEARLLAALLNSSVARAIAVATAERAKDRHFRFFGALIAGLPLPHLEEESATARALIRLARQAEAGAEVREALDIVAMQAYGLEAEEMEVLACFLEAKTGRRA